MNKQLPLNKVIPFNAGYIMGTICLGTSHGSKIVLMNPSYENEQSFAPASSIEVNGIEAMKVLSKTINEALEEYENLKKQSETKL